MPRYVAADELIEVTPTRLRLRKRTLEAGMRRQQRRRDEALAAAA
jgi:GTP-binding protein